MMPIPAGSRYVAMGSSFAAGPGLPSRVPRSPHRAGRSTGNYAHIVARTLGLDLHDVTFSGATTGDILEPAAAGRPAQLDAVTRDTALLTITAGGNDVGFVPRLTLASLPWPLPVLPAVRARIAELGSPSTTDERFERLGQNLAAIGREVHDRAPTCRVILIDYLTLLPPDGDDPGPPPPTEITAWGRKIAARLAATTEEAASALGYDYVAASAASASHHAWSADPWTRRFHLSLRGGAPYHPNTSGMAAVAELILTKLNEAPPTPASHS
jgi:lysophospholipase L1-like esterase